MAEHEWIVGEVRVRKVVEAEAALPLGGAGTMLPRAFPASIQQMDWLIPDFATEEGHLRLSVHALLVETPSTRIIVDTCVGNGKRRTNPFFDMLDTGFLGDLETEMGWLRQSVEGVLCTHLHVDHVGWNTMVQDSRWVPTFPNARYYVGRNEFESWSAHPHGADAGVLGEDSLQPIIDAGLLELVDDDATLAPEIRLKATPGHTPGHVSVVIESQGERAVITGDLMHHPCQVGRPEWSSSFDDDQGRSISTRRGFLDEYADTATLIIGTHFGGPTAGRIVRHGAEFRFVN